MPTVGKLCPGTPLGSVAQFSVLAFYGEFGMKKGQVLAFSAASLF